MSPLSNARHPGETQEEYRARRKTVNKAVKVVLRGKLAHGSSEVQILPLAGVDVGVDKAIGNGRLRDVKLMTVTRKDKTIRQFRVGRTKGITYRKPAEAA